MDWLKTIGKGLVDLQAKVSWRRLAAWVTGTVIFVSTDKIDMWVWLTLTVAFIGSEAAMKVLGARGKPTADGSAS